MASPAEKYLATFSPSEQAQIQASWAGNPNGLQDWFAAALQAGSVNPDGSRGMLNNENEAGGYNYSQNVSGASGLQPGQTPTPTQLRQYARENSWSEDFNRYDDATLQQWINSHWNPQAMKFDSEHGGGLVEKPTEWVNGPPQAGGGPGNTGTGGFAGGGFTGGGWGGGDSWGWGQGGTYGGAPTFNWQQFSAPKLMDDPGYQFRLDQGVNALEKSAAAKGTLRTGGTLKDILSYGQDLGSQEYQNAFNRAAQGWGMNFQGAQAAFQPAYGSWQTTYQGDLSKYLNRENNIYGLLSGPAPAPPQGV